MRNIVMAASLAVAMSLGSQAWGAANCKVEMEAPTGLEAPDKFVHDIINTKLKAEAFGWYVSNAVTSAYQHDYLTPDFVYLLMRVGEIPEPIVDQDLFLLAQDWEISNLKTRVDKQDATSATVIAAFTPYKDSPTKEIIYSLTRKPEGGWKIKDIGSSDGFSIRKIAEEGLKAHGLTP